MSAVDIPLDVRRLIAERIDSVPELEAILLFREYRARSWTAAQASVRLYAHAANGAPARSGREVTHVTGIVRFVHWLALST